MSYCQWPEKLIANAASATSTNRLSGLTLEAVGWLGWEAWFWAIFAAGASKYTARTVQAVTLPLRHFTRWNYTPGGNFLS